MNKDELRKLDYEKTLQYISQLTEIRFKLLSLLPVVTGVALSFIKPEQSPSTGLFIGVFGFSVTFGLVIYDQRNTAIYDEQVIRAKILEKKLLIPPVLGDDIVGGPVGGRPCIEQKLFGISMWHKEGLAIIYTSVLAAWSYLISQSLVTFISPKTGFPNGVSVIIPAVLAVVFWLRLSGAGVKNSQAKTR